MRPDEYTRAGEIRGWLEGVTYKPDTSFTAVRHNDSGLDAVRVSRMLPNSRDPRMGELANYADRFEFVEITLTREVPPFIETREHFLDFLRHVLKEMELHELDEWLRLDGEMVNDPHDQPVPSDTTWTWGGDPKPDPPPPPKELS